MLQTLKPVFSNFIYVIVALAIFSVMLFGLLLVSEYVFLEPYVVSHVPEGTELGFLLIVILCAMSALVVPMNIFRVNALRISKHKMGGGILGTSVGAAAGACSCGPIGFAVISTFGSVGATASAFLTAYEIPIRIVAICILFFTYYTTAKSLRLECKINSVD